MRPATTCAWCGQAYPVASLARSCEAKHEEETNADPAEG